MNRNKTPPSNRLATELLAGTLLGLSLLGPAQAQDTIAAVPNPADAYATDQLTPSSSDLANLLPLVLTSRERRALAERLESSIRTGDVNGAQNDLNAAIEVGTLAIVLSGQLKNPDLLTTLQNLGIKGDGATPVSMDQAANCSTPVALMDLQEAIEREKNYSGMVSQTLNDLMHENTALKARLDTDKASQEATMSELRKALQREQEKADTASRELANLRGDYQALQSAPEQAKAALEAAKAEWETRLREANEQRDATARQLADMEKELRALQAIKEQESVSQSAHVSELEKTLARTQAQGDVLAQELIAVNKELRELKELQQASAMPLVHRIEQSGMDAPLPPPVEVAPPQATSALSQNDAAPSSPQSALPLQGSASAQKPKEPAPVVVASLPQSLDPIPKVASPSDQPKTEDRLTSRADELLRKGDVSGARLLLERALDNRNARAAFLMGETFDPNVLAELRVLGMRGDASKAREFYAQALALGMAEARARMEALK